MTTVLVLTFTEVAKDPRVLRHIEALRSHMDVVSCGKGPAPTGVIDHIELPAGADHLPTTLRGMAGLLTRSTDFAYRNLPAASAARELLARTDFDVAIANDIVALPVALEVAAGRPVLADLHEYAPREMEEDWRWRLMIQSFATALCRTYLPRAAAVTTVAPGIAAEYERQFGVRTVTITNAGPYRAPQPRPVGDPIRLVHSGGATRNRRLEAMIDAAADLPNVTFDLYLVTTRRSAGYVDELRERAARTDNVRVLPPVPMSDVPATLDSYDVGVYLLAPTSFNNEHALPNKFFDFIQSGLGMVIGPSPEMAALVREHGMGLVTPDFSVESLRHALHNLEPAEVAGWRQATCVSAQQLSSEHEQEVLRALVQSIVEG